ncbi:RNA polymerase sigma factor [Arundinibacter roseus]|uniref:Sigma-70 family RNA polymerase sigma factor n=1 Tax=Arundinibacter roseus TaxID=2070510 RepID=A0A4V2XAK1_9BACT|nr:sigma-70 family RNA polymerase sigma factor [Arundinibacter roseus]TDB67915.1 sigma-70 family RNA polymerase sigma factor [Arundinibacter roseus]
MKETGLPPDTSSEDQILWKQMLRGNSPAFERLMALHINALYQYGQKFSKNPEFVKDIIQDLFLYIWLHRDHLNPNIIVRPYLMASLRRMMHRASHKQGRFEHETDITFDVEFSVEQNYIHHENSQLLSLNIRKKLDELPARQKEVIYLKFYQDLSREQISEIMQITPQTVSNLLQIAIKHLRKQWKDAFFYLICFLVLCCITTIYKDTFFLI